MKVNNTGFIGCGSMGSAFIKGMVNSGKVPPQQVWVFDVKEEAVKSVTAECPVNKAENLEELTAKADIIFLAVKPADYSHLLPELSSFLKSAHLVVSMAAGISIKQVHDYLGYLVKIIRIMPNTPCLLGEGAISLAAGSEITLGELDRVKELVSALGKVVTVKESEMNAVTGLSGSGPAYVYLFVEALTVGAVNAGLDRKTAESLALQTVKGAARMLEASGKHPAELRDEVVSPGGTTGAGLFELERGAFRACVSGAVLKAAEKAEELGTKKKQGEEQ